jgi:hypothetical protein
VGTCVTAQQITGLKTDDAGLPPRGFSPRRTFWRCSRYSIKHFWVKWFVHPFICFQLRSSRWSLQQDEKIRYAKWKAADIARAFREGRQPVPGPAGGIVPELNLPSLDALPPPSALPVDWQHAAGIGSSEHADRGTSVPSDQSENTLLNTGTWSTAVTRRPSRPRPPFLKRPKCRHRLGTRLTIWSRSTSSVHRKLAHRWVVPILQRPSSMGIPRLPVWRTQTQMSRHSTSLRHPCLSQVGSDLPPRLLSYFGIQV